MKTTIEQFSLTRGNMLENQRFSPPEIEECNGAECSSPDAFNAEDLMPAKYCGKVGRLERVADGPEVDRYCFECFYDLQACSECSAWLSRTEGKWSWDSRWDSCWVCINCHNAALAKDVDEAKEDTITYKVTIEAVITLTHETTDGDTSTDFIYDNVVPFFDRTFDRPRLEIEAVEVQA